MRCENSGARGGDVVAVLGIGGLGHLGVQFAARMGFNTVAIARGRTRKHSPKNSAHTLHRQPGFRSGRGTEINLGGAKV